MGVITYVPGVNSCLARLSRAKSSRIRDPNTAARYSYAVWLRHLHMAGRSGVRAIPSCVAELGPGTNLGTGLAALLSGVRSYFAFDTVPHAKNESNVKVYDELINLFDERAAIPDNTAWPHLRPELDSYDFPSHLLTERVLKESMSAKRLTQIREEILGVNDNAASGELIRYFAPWDSAGIVRPENVDMVVSQAVMEHVDDLDQTYKTLHCWLKNGGLLSQQIDFSSHSLTASWNGHWACSDLLWKLVRGGRPYLINREPYSTHVRYLTSYGFRVVCEVRRTDKAGINRAALAKRFRGMSEEDLTTRGAFIQAIKTQ